MGLFMVKMKVERLGGSISVESEINKRTVFTIKFPLYLMTV
jgi:chemotaxis protein histidine kinase CheA